MTLLPPEDHEPGKRKRGRPAKPKPPAPSFELINAHARRESRSIDKHLLIVPVDQYQRDESTGRIASEIALHYDVVAFQTLTVIERKNGDLVVADGGTRLAGAMQRDDIVVVPCTVFSGLSEKEESDAFLRINLNRRRLRTEQQHHAELFSEEELAVLAEQYTVKLHQARVGWDGLTTMRGAVKRDLSAIDTVIKVLIKVAVDRHVTTKVMKGLVRLERLLQKEEKTLNKTTLLRKLERDFGTLDAVLTAVCEPRRQGDPNIFARALARTLRIKVSRTDPK